MQDPRGHLGTSVVALAIASTLALFPTPVGAATNPARPYSAGQWDQVIWRDYCDIRHRPPSAAEEAAAVKTITQGNPTSDTMEIRRAALAQRSVDGAGDAFLGGMIRLYQAFFERQPDRSLTYWLERRARGEASLSTVAEAFVRSSEFVKKYGRMDRPTFVRVVYVHTFHRDPDAAGMTYWTDRLARGMQQSQMMLQFSESAEFKEYWKFRTWLQVAFVQMIGRPATDAEILRGAYAFSSPNSFRTAYFNLVESSEYRRLSPSRPKGYCTRP